MGAEVAGEKAKGDAPDIREKGRSKSGETTATDRRLFMQLYAFGGCRDPRSAAKAVADAGLQGVLYEDLNDPSGIGVLTFSEQPDYFLEAARPLFRRAPFDALRFKEEYAMMGRTYSMGWESDLEEALITRPKKRVLAPELRWAVWYPVRRAGLFEELDTNEQHSVLSEHGSIGQSFGRAGIAHDIRLACHGLNKEDNDFIIGVVASELFPLSAIIQRMRKTRQTARYLARLGPFFVGRVLWQAAEA